MRTPLAGLAFLLLAAGPVRASAPLRAPVEVTVTGFAAKLDDGRVVTTWKRYKREDFSAYFVVKSSASAAPLHPETPYSFTSSSKDDVRYEDGRLSLGTWNYRLVIVTRFGDRWVSPAVPVVVDEAAMKRAAPTAADFEL